ncbi:MAG: methyltransferase family protein [Gemmatimonadaceae bacterium]
MDRPLLVQSARGLLQLPIVMGVLLFLPAGTLHYWEAWLFIAVFFACSLAITVYLAVNDPKLLARRLNAGPAAETERTQRVIMALAVLAFVGIIVVPALDRRFGWSDVPSAVVLLGDALIVASYLGFFFVFRENSYGASTIQVAAEQRVISTGPYAIVRHPMYGAALVLLFAIPLALGSWWGLAMFVPACAVIAWRLLDEERFLARHLPGYVDYQRMVGHRLIPYVW